jgi:addiction module HigA family antidote
MMKNGMRAIHPGEILREEYLVPLGMSPHALSKLLNVPPARVNEVVRETRGITPDTALRLARFFGGDAQSWMNLQIAYDLKLTEKAVAKAIAKEVKPLSEIVANDDRFILPA